MVDLCLVRRTILGYKLDCNPTLLSSNKAYTKAGLQSVFGVLGVRAEIVEMNPEG